MNMIFRAAALPGILVFGLLCSSAPAIAGGVSVRGSLVESVDLAPGGKASGEITIVNSSDQAETVIVYPKDYLFYADGTNVYGEPGSVPRSNSAWIHFSPNQLVVPPHGSSQVRWALDVPSSEGLQGTYWSLLMVEGQLALQEPSAQGKVTVSVRTSVRYAVQLVTNIGAVVPDLRFAQREIAKTAQGAELRLDLENTGVVAVSPLVWVEVYDEQGNRVGRFDGTRVRIHPTCSSRFIIPLKNLRPALYHAVVVADNEDDNVFGSQFALDLR